MLLQQTDHVVLRHHDGGGVCHVTRVSVCHVTSVSWCLNVSCDPCLQVKDLAAVSLKQPIRIFVNSNTDVAPFLRQEFVRIRQNREGDREAVVAGGYT